MRIAVFLFALVTSASLLPAVAHAQPPAQLSPPAEPATGSISGRIVIEGQPPVPYVDAFTVVSADTPQPILIEQLGSVQLDAQGNFTVSGLGDGDYLLILPTWWSLVGVVAEEVFLASPILPGITLAAPAIRVTIANGQAVVGIQIVLRLTQQAPVASDGPTLAPPGQLSPALSLSLGAPTTGAGPGGADGATGRVAAGLAVAAALLLAGGVALRARGRRVL